jgi:hypothetical protein
MHRLLAWVADRLMDHGWLRGMRYQEVQATRSARRHERKAEGLRDRVTVPHEGGW